MQAGGLICPPWWNCALYGPPDQFDFSLISNLVSPALVWRFLLQEKVTILEFRSSFFFHKENKLALK